MPYVWSIWMTELDLLEYTRFPYRHLSEELVVRDWLFTSLALDFTMQAQTEDNWCWAAAAASVSHFYRSNSPWTQCLVANAELEQTNCCDAPAPGPCDVPWFLDRALARTENFVRFVYGTVDTETIRAELQAGRVVGARIGWNGGGGHFVMIYGISTVAGLEYLDIDDPIYEKSHITVEVFTNSYQGNGSWTHTYFTKRAPLMLKIKPFLLQEVFVRPIWEARALLQLKHEGLRQVQSARDLAVTLPHYIYTLGLDAIVQDRPPGAPTALRALEVQGNRAQAFFDLTPDERFPQVRQMSGPSPYLERLNRAIGVAARHANAIEPEAELRVIQVPALHLEALWLHYDDAAQDVFIPVRTPRAFQEFQVYSAADFQAAMKSAIAARPPQDDLMGS
jgi:hypothetical protein